MLTILRPYVFGAGAGVLLLVAYWLQDNGYRRGVAECQAKALRTRTEIETRWIRDADVIAQSNQERDDAVAAIDRADAGSAVCLDADSVQRLRAIR